MPGYCVSGTVGAKVLSGAKRVEIEKGQMIDVKLSVQVKTCDLLLKRNDSIFSFLLPVHVVQCSRRCQGYHAADSVLRASKRVIGSRRRCQNGISQTQNPTGS